MCNRVLIHLCLQHLVSVMGAVDIFVLRVDGLVLPFVFTVYHRSFRYVAVDVAVIVYKVALRLVRGIFLFFTLFISFIFLFCVNFFV